MDAKIIEMLTEMKDAFSSMGQKISFIERKMIENEPEEYLTVKEACEYGKISRTTFHELKKEGAIKVNKVRGKILVKKSELIKTIESTLTPHRA